MSEMILHRMSVIDLKLSSNDIVIIDYSMNDASKLLTTITNTTTTTTLTATIFYFILLQAY